MLADIKELIDALNSNTTCIIDSQYKCALQGFPFVWDKETCKRCQENMGRK